MRLPLAPRRLFSLLAVIVTGAVLSGCAYSTAYRPPAPLHARADLQVAGVGVVLSLSEEEWTYTPRNLRARLTPIGVVIRNERDTAIPVTYKHFRLRDNQGFQYAALAPGDVAEYYRVEAPAMPPRKAITAAWAPRDAIPVRHYYRFYPFGFRYRYFYDYYPYPPYWWYDEVRSEVTLRGLQASMLQPGATMAGFLYFQRVDPNAASVRLEWDVAQPNTGIVQTLAIDVPISRQKSY